jgi:hypothetical protein
VLDLVEPAPTDDEVALALVGEDARTLRITATPKAEHRPYALRRGGRLEFPIRFMDRLRPMTRSEVEGAFAGARDSRGGLADSSLSTAERALLDDRQEVLKSDEAIFWLGIEPVDGSPRLKLNRLLESGILEDPTLSDNRWYGINFGLALHAILLDGERATPYVGQGGGQTWLTVGGNSPFELSIGETGSFRSRTLLTEMPFLFPQEPEQSSFPELRDSPTLNSKALLEYPASLFRLLSALHLAEDLWLVPPRSEGEWIASVVLANVEGCYIRPGPDHPAWDYPLGLKLPPPALQRRPRPFSNGRSFVGRELRFSVREILKSPDACAFRLMSQVFAAFGWSEDEIPYFDKTTAKLEFLS